MASDISKVKQSPRQYRHGQKPNWRVVLDAVLALGRPVTVAEVGDYIVKRIPKFSLSNLGPNLSVLSVNCSSRGHHAVNRTPRRTNTGNKYDRLIRIGHGPGVRFTKYIPEIHGVWELVDIGEKSLRPRLFCSANSVRLDEAREAATSTGMFDPKDNDDARRRIIATIVQREGQPKFRKDLLDAYLGACVITGCTVASLLEAAHIVPYRGPHTNVVENGLLLRADIHKLFDLHMLRIDPFTRTVHLCDELRKSEYGNLEGIRLREPKDPSMLPLQDVLEERDIQCLSIGQFELDATRPDK